MDATTEKDTPMQYEKPAAARTQIVGLMTRISGIYIPCDSDLSKVACEDEN